MYAHPNLDLSIQFLNKKNKKNTNSSKGCVDMD